MNTAARHNVRVAVLWLRAPSYSVLVACEDTHGFSMRVAVLG